MCQMLATGHGLKGALYLFLTSPAATLRQRYFASE